MRKVPLLSVFLLCFHAVLSNPTPKGRELIFSYHANIDVRNSACNHGFARWILSGNLRGQNVNNSLILTLEDLKTSIFNGRREQLKQASEKEIPEKTKVLSSPFIIHTEEDGSITIIVEPGEPIWCVNIKRGIASNFKLEPAKIETFTTEKSVHGDCEVTYKKLPSKNDEEIIEKHIDYNKCSNKPFKHSSNVLPGPRPENFSPIEMKTKKTYTLKTINGVSTIHNIHSVSHFAYKPMKLFPNIQHIDQCQEIDLQEIKAIEHEIDVSNINENKNVVFEFTEDTVERIENITELMRKYNENYLEFEKKIQSVTLNNHDIHRNENTKNMFEVLVKLNKDELRKLQEDIDNTKNENVLKKYTLLSLLPYVGTQQSLEFILEYLEKNMYQENIDILTKVLATFPSYLNFPLDEKLEQLENLLIGENLKNNAPIHSAVLSFGSVIGNGFKKGYISQKFAKKYNELFYYKFLDTTLGYDTRMLYLLGLINMDNLNIDTMFEIITNTSEIAHLRNLAVIGFENHITTDPNKVFNKIWPIVQNKSEQFDLRIRALDLLFNTNLTEEQFLTIFQTQLEYKTDLFERHMAHYFITTLQSIQNNTAYKNNLGSLAFEALESKNLHDYSRDWITGNYLLSYADKDPNIGSYFQIRTIGNPKTNTINVLQFSYNHFAMSFDLGTYDIYFKMHGISGTLFKKEFFKDLKSTTSIPEVLNLLKEFNFKFKTVEEDIHFEFVVFIDKKAVFSVYDNLDNIQVLMDDLQKFLTSQSLFISYPLIDYTHIPSDLGTTLSVVHDVQDIFAKKFYNNELNYRSSWYHQIWVKSHNPILDTNLGTYKYYGDEKNINLNFSYTPKSISWKRQNDTLNWVWDKFIGTAADKKNILTEFCPDCKQYNEIPIEYEDSSITDTEYIGFKFNSTNMRREYILNNSDIVQDFLNIHQSNAATMPLLKPILMSDHFINHMYYFKRDLIKGSYRSINFYEELGDTTFTINYGMIGFKKMDPFEKKAMFISAELINQCIDQDLSIWNANYSIDWVPKYKSNDEADIKFKTLQTFYFNYITSENITFRICANRELLIPDTNADKFSIKSVKPTTGVIQLKFGRVEQTADNETCPEEQYNVYETFSSTDDQIKMVTALKHYEDCENDSKDLEFTPPTPSCLPVFMKLSQYTSYVVNMDDITNKSEKVKILETYRIDNDKVKVIASNLGFMLPEDKTIDFTFDYPYRMADPNAISYQDYDILISTKRSCTVSAKIIKTFSGKFLPFTKEKSAVYVECFNVTLRALTVDKLNEKYIGFKLISNKNTLTATVVYNKLILKLNERELRENYDTEDEFKVYFMKENVIYIVDSKIQLYYNTEYLYLKGLSLSNEYTCGYCNEQ